jgi:ferredoxin
VSELDGRDRPAEDRPRREVGGLTVLLDRDSCIGSGSCVAVAPAVFELDSMVQVAFVPEDDQPVARELLIEACQVCPVDAITLLDGDGDRVCP